MASRGLADPNFAHTVILLFRYGDDGAAGLILNRRTNVAIGQALSDFQAARGRKERIFQGGPVEKDGALALLRAAEPPEGAEGVLKQVYLLSTKSALEKALGGTAGNSLRVYLGYAGWTADQLEREIDLGAWNVMNATPEVVFDPEPDTLWTRLIRQSELRIARAPNVFFQKTLVRECSSSDVAVRTGAPIMNSQAVQCQRSFLE